jgi:hypothetical protein
VSRNSRHCLQDVFESFESRACQIIAHRTIESCSYLTVLHRIANCNAGYFDDDGHTGDAAAHTRNLSFCLGPSCFSGKNVEVDILLDTGKYLGDIASETQHVIFSLWAIPRLEDLEVL